MNLLLMKNRVSHRSGKQRKAEGRIYRNSELLALVDWISPEYENNKEVVQHKLYEFMRRMEQHKDK